MGCSTRSVDKELLKIHNCTAAQRKPDEDKKNELDEAEKLKLETKKCFAASTVVERKHTGEAEGNENNPAAKAEKGEALQPAMPKELSHESFPCSRQN